MLVDFDVALNDNLLTSPVRGFRSVGCKRVVIRHKRFNDSTKTTRGLPVHMDPVTFRPFKS